MAEANESPLEVNRFVVNPQSIEGMKKLRATFQGLKQKYPYLSGLGFFGSRTKGTEHEGSDYDVCVFYNSDRINDLRLGTRDQWRDIRNTLIQNLGAQIDHRIEDPSAGVRINISKVKTKSEIEELLNAAKPLLNKEIDEDTLLKNVGIPPIQNLYSRFFLCTGDEVYENRKSIFDQLKTDPNGDKYFSMLMKAMAWFERGNDKAQTPRYNRYPQTIDEAEKYFLSRPDKENLH